MATWLTMYGIQNAAVERAAQTRLLRSGRNRPTQILARGGRTFSRPAGSLLLNFGIEWLRRLRGHSPLCGCAHLPLRFGVLQGFTAARGDSASSTFGLTRIVVAQLRPQRRIQICRPLQPASPDIVDGEVG